MIQKEEWPVEFIFHPATKETTEESDASNYILCGFDHSNSDCLNTVRVCKYYGGI